MAEDYVWLGLGGFIPSSRRLISYYLLACSHWVKSLQMIKRRNLVDQRKDESLGSPLNKAFDLEWDSIVIQERSPVAKIEGFSPADSMAQDSPDQTQG